MMSTQTKHLPDFIRLAFDKGHKVDRLPTMNDFLGILTPSPTPLPTPELQQPEPLSPPDPQQWLNQQMDRVLTHLDAWEEKRFSIEMLSEMEEVVNEAREMMFFASEEAKKHGLKVNPSGLATALDITTQYMRAYHHPAEVPPDHAVH